MSVPFITAYETGLLSQFFALTPLDSSAAFRIQRPAVGRDVLVSALRQFAETHNAPQAVLANIDRLANPNARVVITGQQTGLLLGPGYTASKAATAIRLAREHDSEDQPVIPVFWLATQDHDVAEINHTALLSGEERPERLTVDLPVGPMAGRITLDESHINEILHTVERIIGPDAEFREETLTALRESADGVSFSHWFAKQLWQLFGEAGLVIIDPLIPEIAALAKPMIERELAHPQHTAGLINSAGERLEELGYSMSLGRGVGATNLFLEVTQNGQSERLALKTDGDTFTAGERKFTAEQLMQRFDEDPTCITPAAGLRPIMQDFLFPTAIFVVGPGEIRYVAQLKDVYDWHDVPMPLVWRRPVLTFVEPAPQRVLAKLGVDAHEFQRNSKDVVEHLSLARTEVREQFEHNLEKMLELIEEQKKLVLNVDPTLVRPVTRAGAQAERALQRLTGQAARSALRADEELTQHVHRLRQHLLPFNGPSERMLSVWTHIAKFGIQPVIRAYLQAETTGDQVIVLDS